MLDQDFMIHILTNLTEEDDVVLGGMESRLILDKWDPNKLTIEDIQENLNNWAEWIRKRGMQVDK